MFETLKRMKSCPDAAAIFFAMFALFAFISLVAPGCGGGSTTVTPPAPNPEVRRTMEVRVIAVNPVKGNQPITGATITYEDEDGNLKTAGNTDSSGSILIANLAEGEYTINVLHGATSTPNFAAETDVSFILASGSTTATINVDPLYNVEVHVIESATPLDVSDAEVVISGTEGNFLKITGATGTVIFEGLHQGSDFSAIVRNLGYTNPRIGLDTTSVPFQLYEDLTGDKAVEIGGTVPACFSDADCEAVMPSGMTVADCYNEPGTETAACRYQ